MTEEESFPRGGKRTTKRPPSKNDELFNTNKPKKAKKQKPEPSSERTSEPLIVVKGSLTYSKIQTDMVILGCIRNITNFSLEIELPGLCFALVKVTEISDPFTKFLNRQLEIDASDEHVVLSKLFSVGQFLPVKIKKITNLENKTHLEGSINPRDIYAEHSHNAFKKEMLVWACVKSKTDHGYEMSLGLKNCRAFLPAKNASSEEDYSTGKPFWCVVHKADNNHAASTLRLSSKLEHIKLAESDIDNLHSIIPGTRVQFIPEKISDYGIQGKIAEKFNAYVGASHLDAPLKKPHDYQVEKPIWAYVLFIEPILNIVHLTLRCPQELETATVHLKVGQIVQGQVFSKTYNGVFFTLPNKLKGFVTNKRLINTLKMNEDSNIAQLLEAKYSMHSKHTCRILDYNYMTKTYICTPESSVLKENVFVEDDLTPGQLVNLSIVSIKDEGIVVEAGHVKGFVPNLHIANTEYTHNVKKAFKTGQQNVKGRVLSTENGKILFTLKPAMVQNDICLSKLEDAKIGEKYPGVVAKLTNRRALVVFYQNTKGYIGQQEMGVQATDPSKYLFVGQVVNFYVFGVKDSQIRLGLFHPEATQTGLNVGSRHIAIVQSVTDKGVNIKLENNPNHEGFIPNVHLSSNLSLCEAIKGTYVPGDTIKSVMFVGGNEPKIFSRRENGKVKHLSRLRIGDTVRCFYHSTTDEGILVLPLIKRFSKLILLPAQDVGELVPHQLILTKVISLNLKKATVELKLKNQANESIESIMNHFTNYLSELTYLNEYAKEKNWKIADFVPGKEVTCKVEKLGPQGGCVVSLPNKIKGVVVPFLCPKTLTAGESLTGKVISLDYERQYVDICLKPEICRKINTVQNASLKEPIAWCFAEKLLVKDECVISLLKHKNGNGQLVYSPIQLYANDFEGSLSYYSGNKYKVCICGTYKYNLIGINKTLFLYFDKKRAKALKRKADNEDTKTETTKKLKRKAMEIEELQEEPDDNEFEDFEQDSTEADVEIEDSVNTLSNKTAVKEVATPSEPTDVDIETINSLETSSSKTAVKQITMPSAASFFSPADNEAKFEESSSEDEEDGAVEKKKKKLSPAERAEMFKKEEERISKIENELADPSKAPESAEQFDRLLLAQPDSAQLWAAYIAFHVAATEIDKARAVAKRALKTINMTLIDEKFKIWTVLLNLENMYGTHESFQKTFEEAIKFNDSLQVYLKAIEMLGETGKYSEMEEKINKARVKHKQEPTMWLEVARIYFQIGKSNEARNWKNRAIKSIIDKKAAMNFILRFGILEFQHGELEQGSAIFETVLMADPKKINIWFTYVDQLVKKHEIDAARLVLERVVRQTLPLKSMKSAFMKFRKFEEKHGTPEQLEIVKQKAQDYVNSFENK